MQVLDYDDEVSSSFDEFGNGNVEGQRVLRTPLCAFSCALFLCALLAHYTAFMLLQKAHFFSLVEVCSGREL